MSTRRRFIAILPLAGISLFAACGDKAAPPASAAAPAPTPTPAPTPGPAPAHAEAAAPPPAPAAAAAPLVDPADPAAVALGYVADASTAKDPRHLSGAACGNCALFGGKAGDASGPCPLFAGKQVSSKGWCTAHAKKA